MSIEFKDFVEAVRSRSDIVDIIGADTDLRPAGVAEVAGERIDVVSEGDFVQAGTAITVVRAEGYRHVVRVTRAATQLPA